MLLTLHLTDQHWIINLPEIGVKNSDFVSLPHSILPGVNTLKNELSSDTVLHLRMNYFT